MIGVAVTGKASGLPFAALPTRPNAYRRSDGSTAILEPCFAPPDNRSPLACSRAHWSATVTLLPLSRPLPYGTTPSAHDPDYAAAKPWGPLELANATRPCWGQRRRLLDCGSTPAVRDSGVAGGSDRTLPLWRVFYQSAHESLSLTRVTVAVA